MSEGVDMNRVGEKVGHVFYKIEEAIAECGLTVEELKEFETYVDQAYTMGPLFSPQLFGGGARGFDALREVSARIHLLYKFFETIDSAKELREYEALGG